MDIHHHHFKLIGSTNTWAKQHAAEFDRNAITLVTADSQTSGRGRLGRRWLSPPNLNVYATYCVFLAQHRPDIGNLPQVAALSVAQILSAMGLKPLLKWPNDVLVAGKKICGVLSEAIGLPDSTCLLIGIGLNVNMDPKVLSTIDQPVTSLLVETHRHYEVLEVLHLLTHRFAANIREFSSAGFASFLPLYRSLIYIPHHPITVGSPQSACSGTIHSIADDGSLRLLLPDNTIKDVHSGEIIEL